MYISMWNHEHYHDPTAGLALRAVMREKPHKRCTPSVFKPAINICNPVRGEKHRMPGQPEVRYETD